jgi:hypothetical protein
MQLLSLLSRYEVLSYSEWEENSIDESEKIPVRCLRELQEELSKCTAYEMIHETC